MTSVSELWEVCYVLSVSLTWNKWQRPRQGLLNNLSFNSLICKKHTGNFIISIVIFPFPRLTILLKLHIASLFHVFVFCMGIVWWAKNVCLHSACHLDYSLVCRVFQCDCISIHLLTEVAMLQTGILVIETNKACCVIDLYVKTSQQNQVVIYFKYAN